MVIQKSIQSANFDLVNTYDGIDGGHTYDGIDVGHTFSSTGMANGTDSCMLTILCYFCNWIKVLITQWFCIHSDNARAMFGTDF